MSEDIVIRQLNLLSDKQFGPGDICFNYEWDKERKRREEDCKHLKFKTKRTKQVKEICRTGLPPSQRRRWWFVLSGGFDLYLKVGDVYRKAIEGAKNASKDHECWKFGVSYNITDFVPQQIAEELPTFLRTLWYYNKNIEYSPLICSISAMLLMFLEPNLAYLCMQAMINKSKDDLFYILITKKQFYQQLQAIEQLILERNPNLAKHTKKIGIDLKELLLAIFPSFFIPFMSFPASLTLFDSFLSEGRKVLFRFTLQILDNEEKHLLKAEDKHSFKQVLFHAVEDVSNPEYIQKFIKKAFKQELKRKGDIQDGEKKDNEGFHAPIQLFNKVPEFARFMLKPSKFLRHRSKSKGEILPIITSKDFLKTNEIKQQLDVDLGEEVNDDISSNSSDSDNNLNQSPKKKLRIPCPLPPHPSQKQISIEVERMKNLQMKIAKKTLPKIEAYGGNLILNESILLSMRCQLPALYAEYTAQLVYKMSIDGTSFITIFNKCSIKCQYILLIKTEKRVIGAFLSDALQPHEKGHYYGSRLTFVFDPINYNYYKLKHPPNDYFISVSDDTILIGYHPNAIVLTKGLGKVISDPCDTFGSPRLTENKNGDKIIDMELYRYCFPYGIKKMKRRNSSVNLSKEQF